MITAKKFFLTSFQVNLVINIAAVVGGQASSGDNEIVKCLHEERQALLDFKAMLIDGYGNLSSWENGNDCCQWEGILCDNRTNRVVALDLSNAYRLRGKMISPSLLKLVDLNHLDLSHIDFNRSQIPEFIGSFDKLQYLNMSFCNFWVMIPNSLGNLFPLEQLDLGSNHLEGLFSKTHLFNLSKLQCLRLSSNFNLIVRIDTSWRPPFQLASLGLANCKLGPHFSKWLQNQGYMRSLDISDTEINDTIPNWFWKNIGRTWYLNMSHNKIHGLLPDLSSKLSLKWVDLSFNQFNGSLPRMPSKVHAINLSSNKFFGDIMAMCSFMNLTTILDLSNNLLFGQIVPNCFIKLMHLVHLNLANNNLSGKIQAKYSTCKLSALYLRNNSFTGNIPKSLVTCHDWIALDLGENKFYGNIPYGVGENMPKLVILSLKSNNTPSSLCRLSRIQVFDISINKISGIIPNCVNNFTMLSSKSNFLPPKEYGILIYRVLWGQASYDSASIIWKRMDVEYINTHLWLLKIIDLSSNKLSGEIPHEVMSLVGLVALNLSRNNLVGPIPHDIDQLEILNFLDLSQNNLLGNIPSTISQLSHLGILDLSFNNLSGKIPFDTHMDTFNAFSYIGNPELCGPPLISKPCPKDEEMPKKAKKTKHEHMLQSREFYVSLALGFSIAFLGVCWTLFFRKKWNMVTNKMFIRVEDWVYVKVRVSMRCLKRYFGNCLNMHNPNV